MSLPLQIWVMKLQTPKRKVVPLLGYSQIAASVGRISARNSSLTSSAGSGSIHPPVQHLNKSRYQVLDKKIGWNLDCRFTAALKTLSNVIGNQLRQHLLQVFMKDGSAPRPDLGLVGAPVLIVVLEDRKTEPNGPFVPLCRGRWLRRLHRTKHVLDAADEQFVFVTEVGVKS
jgi:hypothetical protein